MLLKRLSLLLSVVLLTNCYNGERTLIPKRPFVPEEVQQGYNISVSPKVDILFLIDDSGSMGVAQDKLAKNISLFTTEMEKNKFLDYQIGVISTSIGFNYADKSGKLQGNPKFVTRKTPNGLLALAQNIKNVGTSGDYEEKFFDPLYAAIDTSKNLNPGFLRSDAFFVLIFITDTTDQSLQTSSFKVINTLINSKAYDYDRVLGYGVMSYPAFFMDSCGQDDREPDNLLDFLTMFTNAYNTKIGGGLTFTPTNPTISKDFFDLTNVFSLCDPLFGDKLANIGDDIRIRVSQKIPLPVRPVDGTIKVKFGTQDVDPKWWRYDFGTNSIILDPKADLDTTDPNAQLFVIMDQAAVDSTIGKPPAPKN